MLQVGTLVDNKYKILSEVGHGGMSVVYLAINERANKTWAIKEVRKNGTVDFEAVKQGLVAETDMLKKLSHPYMPSIIDVINTEDSFLIVMDYIEGTSLQNTLKKYGAQPKELVVQWGKQLCDVLGYLHSREPAIIYRDMKPSNVMLKPNGDITLIDFGTAREFKNRAMVEDTTCLGTRGYAAPEQFGGRGQTDARTDIYCLGATLYHLITGHSPAEPPYEIKPLGYWNPNFAGSGLEMIINKCCQQDPNARYQNCAELLYDLEHESEWDYAEQMKRKRKWNSFVASVVVGLVGVAGMIGFTIAKNAMKAETYEYYLGQAAKTSEFSDFVDYVKDAIEVDPSGYEAYDTLLTRIESDGYFDRQTEFAPIKECLAGKSQTESRTNESYLERADQELYADIQLRVGKLLFLMSSGDKDLLSLSTTYFGNALDKGGLAEATDAESLRKANMAKSLMEIGQNIEKLGSQTSAFLESEFTYMDLWNSLYELANSYSIDSMGKRSYGIAMYNRVAFMISENCADFISEGVPANDMYSLLSTLESALQQTSDNLTQAEKNGGFTVLIEGALQNITTARRRIQAYEGGVG